MSASDDLVQQAISELSHFFVGDRTLRATLGRVADLSREALPEMDYVGVTLMTEGRPSTVAFTDPEVVEIDESQYRSGTGPCLDALRHGKPMVVDSTGEPGEWAEFRAAARERGVFSALALPLGALGALNLYSRTDHAVSADDVAVGQTFAAQATFLLANAQAYWDARTLSENLEKALESRSTIDQAKGIIMGSAGCTPDEAMRLLIQQSQHQNVKLRDVAAEIVANASRRRS